MRRVGWLVGAIAVLGLGMTACGDDSSSSTPTTAAAGSTAPTTALPATSEPSTSTTAPAETETLFYAKEGRIFAVVPGESPVAVTEGPRDDQPAPSPDGDHLAFIRLEKDGDTAGELWIANADGSDARLLVPIGISQDPASSEGEPAAAFRPTWSPDSSSIAFMTTIGLDGGDLELVDFETEDLGTPEPPVWVSSYSWARDSNSIVYVSGTNDVSPVDIGVLDVESLETSPLVEATAAYGGVSVAPTGSEVIFVNSDLPLPTEGDGGFALSKPGLYSVALTGGEPTTVAPDPDPDDYRWGVRDNAKCLWYARQFAEGTGELLLHRLCTGDPEPATPVTNLAIFPALPAVSSSNAIAYLVEGDEQSLFVLTAPDADPIHIDDGVTAFAWVG
jgi:hypothetical protein